MQKDKNVNKNIHIPLLNTIVEALQEKKGKAIVSLDLRSINSSITDYFVICHGTSKMQVSALADEVMEKTLKNASTKPYSKEGFENAEWILIDYVDVVVHIFLEQTRDFYQIEKLWADAARTEHVYAE